MPHASDVLCDIIVVCWNQRGHTQRCVDSVCAHTEVPSRLILVDNGSEPETAVFLEGVQPAGWIREVRRLRNATNEGYARGVNRGLREATAPWVCLLNNDTIVHAGWLSEMIGVMESEPRLGLLNPASNMFGMVPVKKRTRNADADRAAGGHAPRWMEATGCVGFCLLMRRGVLERLGMLDERFGIGYFEDADYSVRARAAGYDCGVALRAYVFHVGGASFQLVPNRNELFRLNEATFYEKWPRERPERIAWILCPPTQAGHEHHQARMEQIRQCANRGHKIWVFAPPARSGHAPWHLSVVLRVLPRPIFPLGVLWGVLTKKKPFERIVVEDGRWAAWLRRLLGAHGTQRPSVDA